MTTGRAGRRGPLPRDRVHPLRAHRDHTEIAEPLPYNSEAERSVLGAIILDGKFPNNALAVAMATGLNADDFFLDHHRLIFRQMCTLEEEHIPNYLVVLTEKLHTAGALDAAGGAPYLAQLLDGLSRISNLEHYARIVKEKARLRKTIHRADALMRRAFDEDIEGVERAIANLSSVLTAPEQKNELRSYTPRELVELVPQPIEWIAFSVAAKGMLTLVDGDPKSAGKTTLITMAIGASFREELFLNQATRRCPIIYLTEEPRRSFTLPIRKAGLIDMPDLHIIFASELSLAWPQLVQFVERKCVEVKAQWLICDTFYDVAGIVGDQESKAGVVLEAVRPVRAIASRLDIAITLGRHRRKAGGDPGQSGRGSTALTGAADIVLELTRVSSHEKMRKLEMIGRAGQVRLTIELAGMKYGVVSGGQRTEVKRVVAFVLKNAPCNRTKVKDEIAMKSATVVSAINDALDSGFLKLDDEGLLAVSPEGTKFLERES